MFLLLKRTVVICFVSVVFAVLLPVSLVVGLGWSLLSTLCCCCCKRMGSKDDRMKVAIHNYKADFGVSVSEKRKPQQKECPQGFVIVKVMAAGTNPVDAKAVFGDKFLESMMGLWHWVFTGKTVGFDYSGVVEFAPEGSTFKKGDQVFGLNYQYPPQGVGTYGGTYAQYIMAPTDQMWHKPSTLSFVEASVLPLVGVTCLQAMEQHHVPNPLVVGESALQPKQEDGATTPEKPRILVVGASGGVGHIVTQVAAAFGCQVTGVCGTSNVEFVQQCGADYVVDYRQSDPIKQLEEVVEQHGKFHVCFDTVSSADSRDQASAYYTRIKASGKILESPDKSFDRHNYVVFGGSTFSFFSAAVKRFLRLNIFPKGFELFWIKMPQSQKYLEQLATLTERERPLKPKVQEELPLTTEGVQKAFRSLNPPRGESRKVSGKIAIVIDHNQDE